MRKIKIYLRFKLQAIEFVLNEAKRRNALSLLQYCRILFPSHFIHCEFKLPLSKLEFLYNI